MGVTLVINPGSSSKKYAWYQDGQRVLTVAYERTSDGIEVSTEHRGVRQPIEHLGPDTYREALDRTLKKAAALELVSEAEPLAAVCIRIVAPGSYFQQHVRITDEYVARLKQVEAAAPLHVPHMLAEIETVRAALPQVPFVAASDSAAHASMPSVARTYSIPPEDTRQYDLYRFGYHGLSVASVTRRLPAFLGSKPSRVIVAHVGSGVSVTAFREGQSVDTSMGFAPGTGVMMASRAGDVDTGALLELMRVKHLQLIDCHAYLQTRGGLAGLAGDSDLRRVLERRANGDEAAAAAIEQFAYLLRKQIGAYVAALGGIDALVLTATAAERSPLLRQAILGGLDAIGLWLHEEENEACVGRDGIISPADSPAVVAVMRTDEMGEMYRVAQQLS